MKINKTKIKLRRKNNIIEKIIKSNIFKNLFKIIE